LNRETKKRKRRKKKGLQGNTPNNEGVEQGKKGTNDITTPARAERSVVGEW